VANFVGTLVGILVGSLVTWWVSRHHYVKASRELEEAAAGLRRLTTLITRGMEEAGLVTFTKDAAGNPIGLVINVSAHSGGTSKVTAQATLVSGTLGPVPKAT
jgi:Tfp pilus assembly ATPase PilU